MLALLIDFTQNWVYLFMLLQVGKSRKRFVTELTLVGRVFCGA